jgi:hypothetical protein
VELLSFEAAVPDFGYNYGRWINSDFDTFSGKTLKTLSGNNPIFSSKQTGTFSEEKAKVKAIDVTIANLGRSLAKELDDMDWFCRIARVEGEEVYLNAGRLTGLKVGDVMEVFGPGGYEKQKRDQR